MRGVLTYGLVALIAGAAGYMLAGRVDSEPRGDEARNPLRAVVGSYEAVRGSRTLRLAADGTFDLTHFTADPLIGSRVPCEYRGAWRLVGERELELSVTRLNYHRVRDPEVPVTPPRVFRAVCVHGCVIMGSGQRQAETLNLDPFLYGITYVSLAGGWSRELRSQKEDE